MLSFDLCFFDSRSKKFTNFSFVVSLPQSQLKPLS